MPATPFPTVTIGSIRFARTDLDSAARWVVEESLHRPGIAIRLANAYNVSLADRDPAYRALLSESGLAFPDGRSVVMSMRLLGIRDGRQVRGPSLFGAVLKLGAASGIRHFLVGTTPQTLDHLETRLGARIPGLEIVGSYAPPFAPVDESFIDDIVQRIPVECDVVWVGLGTPKQDFAAAAIARRTGALVLGVGAAFDFHAGTVREAPRWMQRAGVEWLFRLASEPRRLWRRYVFGNGRFVAIVGRQVVRARPRAPQR